MYAKQDVNVKNDAHTLLWKSVCLNDRIYEDDY